MPKKKEFFFVETSGDYFERVAAKNTQEALKIFLAKGRKPVEGEFTLVEAACSYNVCVKPQYYLEEV